MVSWTERDRVVTAPLGTIRYGELVVMVYAPAIIALTALVVGAVRHRRTGPTVTKRSPG
jgi:hypothetical protein